MGRKTRHRGTRELLTNQEPQKTQAIFSAGETKNAGKPFWPNEYFCEICRNKAPLFSRSGFVNGPKCSEAENAAYLQGLRDRAQLFGELTRILRL